MADIRLDRQPAGISRDVELQLGPKEFALLELFLRHRARFCHGRESSPSLGFPAYEANSNVVDQ